MKNRIFTKAYAALLLYLGLLPLFLLPAAALDSRAIWPAALLPLPALLFTGGAALLPGRRRPIGLLGAAVLLAAAYAVVFLPGLPLGLLLFLPCLLSMLLFMPAMARPAHEEWTVSFLGIGILVHTAAQVLKGVAVFAAAAPVLPWGFAAYLLACLFAFNRVVLTGASATAPKPLLAFNRGMIVGFALLSLLLANIRTIAAAIRVALFWIAGAVATAIFWIASLFTPDTLQASNSGADTNLLAGLAEEAEPSLLARILEIVFMGIAALISAVLLFFALRHLYRLLRKAFRALGERLQLYRQRISADYQDQSESLLDWGEIRQTARQRLSRLKRRYLPTPWEKLTPAQRVRRVYALLLRRPQAPDPALTAQEMLTSGALKIDPEAAAALAALYDRARYSSHPVAPAEADALRKRAGV